MRRDPSDSQIVGFDKFIRVDATTSAPRDEVDLALTTSIVAAGFELDRENLDGTRWTRSFEAIDGWISLEMIETGTGGTNYNIDYVLFSNTEQTETIAASAQWAGNGPWGNSQVDEVSGDITQRTAGYTIEIHNRFEQPVEAYEGALPSLLEQSEWTITNDRGVFFEIQNTNGAQALLDGFQGTNPATSEPFYIQIFQYEGPN